MTFFRLSLCAAVLSFGSCSLSTAPEPPAFKLSAESLSQQYPAVQGTEAGRLYAGKILVTQDEEGRKTYLGSGGALLVTTTEPPIQALAPSITVTPEGAEAHGKATVKKGGRLYLGEDESAIIRIQGTDIKPEGPHAVRGIAETKSAAPEGTSTPETVDLTLALTPSFDGAAPLPPTSEPAPAPPSKPMKVKKAASAPQPKAKKSQPAKPSAAIVKASSPQPMPAPTPTPPIPPMPKPKEVPAIDRSRLLNLMREPTER